MSSLEILVASLFLLYFCAPPTFKILVIRTLLRSLSFVIILALLFVCFFNGHTINKVNYKRQLYPPNLKSSLNEQQWRMLFADSLLQTLSLEEKVGQLFMVSAYSNRSEKYYAKLEEQIKKYRLGGLIFFQGDPSIQVNLTNRYQSIAKVPLLIGIDAEWGLGMRLDKAFSFPKAITMGATGNAALVQEVGEEMGKHCGRMGIHFNFAPDADVNTNPQNPVINYRSFGSSPQRVADFSSAFAKGLKKANILSSAKHFPGHGNTREDSHKTMPSLREDKSQILKSELLPFKRLIADSISSIMVGHISAPAFDPRPNMPASISEPIIKGFLKGELLYSGLVISDALNMRGLLQMYPTGVAESKAFAAGNDILLQTADIDISFPAVLRGFTSGNLAIKDLDYSVGKILMAKKWAGVLDKKDSIESKNLITDLNSPKADHLKQKVFDEAITVVKCTKGLLPITKSTSLRMASIGIAAKSNNKFQSLLSLYGGVKKFTIPFKPSSKSDWAWVAEEASKFDLVFISIHETHNSDARNFGIVPEALNIIKSVSAKTKVVLTVFGNPYCLRLFQDLDNVICAYEDDPMAETAAANAIFGMTDTNGKVPITTLGNKISMETGISLKAENKLALNDAFSLGFNPYILDKIRPLIEVSISNGEFPGCQILVARKGKVAFYESFGSLRYGNEEPVNLETRYDLASLTKVTATLQAVMSLFHQKKLDLDQTLGFYLKSDSLGDKATIKIRDLLLHQAGLKSFIPFWVNIKNGNFADSLISKHDKPTFLKVSEGIYLHPSMKDSVFKWIISSPLASEKRHIYSDLGMILLQKVVESISGKVLDEYCNKTIFGPLGLKNTSFNPLSYYNIAPTEYDRSFRNSQLLGTVHDSNAALLGGVAGHAGLFSNAWDLAKILQMNLNDGTYEGHQYFGKGVVDFFAKGQSEISHRGLGWNKPKADDGSVSEYASELSFGHTGYTGTVLWVDPSQDLIFIFLTNRIYPNISNKLIKNKTRKRVHDLVYEAIIQ